MDLMHAQQSATPIDVVGATRGPARQPQDRQQATPAEIVAHDHSTV